MMDTSLTPAEPAPFEPRAHPERSLIAVIVLVAVVCVGLWWTGAVGPRLSAVVVGVESADPSGGRGTVHIEVRNEGRLPVEVRGVSVDDRRGAGVEVGQVLIDGRVPGAAGVRVGAGDVVRLELPYTVDCDRPTGYGADPDLGVRVRAPLGVTQTRPVGTGPVDKARRAGTTDFVDRGPLLCPSR
jgi:hypothetical protein